MSKIENEIFIPTYLYDKDHNFGINVKIEKVRKDRYFMGNIENIDDFYYEFLKYHRGEIIKNKTIIPDESIKYSKIVGKKIRVSIEIVEDVSAGEETPAQKIRTVKDLKMVLNKFDENKEVRIAVWDFRFHSDPISSVTESKPYNEDDEEDEAEARESVVLIESV